MPCILKIKFNFVYVVITAKNKELLLKIFCGPFFCLFLVKSAKIRPQIFISAAPFELFGRNFCLATLQHWLCVLGVGEEWGGWGGAGLGIGGGVTCPPSLNSHLAATCRKIST